ncbi:unnamed protein product [Diatraea saccharalis]|uniref:Uncharacterized protein n=1 Tax=Diatraea saccharalis TaxID=40085 RepID=A0A9N9W4T5_9NEOP|nr:unnamed protein product [Diatraea saccharalis]
MCTERQRSRPRQTGCRRLTAVDRPSLDGASPSCTLLTPAPPAAHNTSTIGECGDGHSGQTPGRWQPVPTDWSSAGPAAGLRLASFTDTLAFYQPGSNSNGNYKEM